MSVIVKPENCEIWLFRTYLYEELNLRMLNNRFIGQLSEELNLRMLNNRFIGQLSEESNLRMLNNRFIGQLSEILTNFVFRIDLSDRIFTKNRNIWMKSLIAQCSKIPIEDNKISQCCLEWVVNKLDLLQNES